MNQIIICYSTHIVWINEPDTHLLQHSHCLDQRTRCSSVTAPTLSGSTNQILICYSTHTVWINEPDTHLLQHSHCLFPTKSVMMEIADSCVSSRWSRLSRVKLRLPKKISLHSASKVFSSAILASCSSFILDSSSCRHRRLNGTKRAAANIHYLTERTGILIEKDNNNNKTKQTNKQNKQKTKQKKQKGGGGEGRGKIKRKKERRENIQTRAGN